jgi:hypothetical protein
MLEVKQKVRDEGEGGAEQNHDWAGINLSKSY